MKSGKTLDKMPIYSIADGKFLGEISEIYLNDAATRIMAVTVSTEGLLNRKTYVVPRDAVQVYGEDCWLTPRSEAVMNLDDVPNAATFLQASKLKGRQVHTEGGTSIGTIEDILLDANAHVMGFSLGKVAVQGPVAERKYIAHGAMLSLGDDKTPAKADLARAETLTLA